RLSTRLDTLSLHDALPICNTQGSAAIQTIRLTPPVRKSGYRMQRRKTRTRQEVASVWNNLRRLRFQHDRNDIETFGSQHDVPCSARSTSDSRDLTEDVASVALFRTRMAVGMKSAGQVVGPSCLTSGSRCGPGAPSGYYPKGY